MCIAFIKPSNYSLPDLNFFKNCFDNNPHGAGFVVNKFDGYNVVFKGYESYKELYRECCKYISKNDVAIVHFRYATHGIIDKHNCHPFFCTNDLNANNIYKNAKFKYKALVHNGVLNIHRQNNDSDSFTFATKCCNKIIDNNKIIESNNKIAILNCDGTVETYGNWIKYNNILCSNATFRLNLQYWKEKRKKDYKLCDLCGDIGENYITTDVGYNFCVECSNKHVYWHKCQKCNKKSIGLYCNECFEKFNMEENYFK